jgi:PAS domain S-box-containing protein
MNQPSSVPRQALRQWKPQWPGPLSAIQRYSLAVLSVSAALGGSLFLGSRHVREVEVPLLVLAVAVAAWYGGAGPAALALVLSCIGFDYFFAEPLYTLDVSHKDLPYFIVFAVFASLVSWFSAVRWRIENELRQARDELQIEVAERAQQASLLNLTHDAIFARDMNGIITYWNSGAQELYGWTPEEAIGKRSHDLFRTGFPEPLEDINAQLLKTGRWDGELRHTKSDGNVVVVSSRWSVRHDGQGRPTVMMETSNDITERKDRERQITALNEELGRRSAELAASNKELEAFAYSVSHDLRAPLRHMRGFTELLKKSAASTLSEKSQRYVAIIRESAKRMGDLIDDLLAFSRIGRAETHKTTVSLEQIVQEALTEVRQDTQGRVIEWRVGAMPPSYGDRSMLRLALVNLISNAVKFTRTRPKAEIEVGCTDQGQDRVVVFVRDNGVGFDMKYVDKLFGVFQRLHPNNAFEGTGIGLATVQRIVHRHGGRVWAEGMVDQGATFYFSLLKSRESNG